MTFEHYLDLFGAAVLVIVAVSSVFFSIKAWIQKRYGFAGWLNRQKYILLITAIFCACYSLNLYFGNLALYREYVENGAQTEGYVYHITKRERRGLKSARFNYYHAIRYQDRQQKRHDTVYRDNCDMAIGDKVEVYYKPNNPEDAYVVTYRESLFNTVIGIIHGVCWGLLIIVALVIIRLNRKAKS